MVDFEKLGVFYLGRTYDMEVGKPKEGLLLYDSKDLVTHAVCVGMTGSGKTGLCIGLLEEAAIDGIPAIAIDPKGDLANLLLTFPGLSPDEFAPWINPDDAAKKGLSPEQFACQQAELWKNGLAEWGQTGERIRKLREAADFAVYTPGSSAGIPLSILKSFDAPEAGILDDAELLNDRVNGTATSLLGLLGIDADPLKSREHILLSNILKNSWTEGDNLDLPALIGKIQNPGIERIGVLDLESFFPPKERFGLAMRINNLIAAPGFETWLQGEPLSIDALLHTAEGKPRISIISIAHLNDAERMFVVSLLLNQVLSWVRTQSGTSSLRALLYMDEIFGYFPPVANPPSKPPLLTLLKQARAFGLGVVLATQNPVDLDYKGLANAGTWFIGRLQTERDKARVLDGLEGVSSTAGVGFRRGEMERILSGLGARVFLMNNVHEDAPVAFTTRWTLSYLRGPLSRTQIKGLMQDRKTASAQLPAAPGRSVFSPTPAAKPLMPPGIPEYFIPYRGEKGAGQSLCYVPMVIGIGKVFVRDAKKGVESEISISQLAGISDTAAGVDWQSAEPTDMAETDFEKQADSSGAFAGLPSAASKSKSYESWKRSFADTLYRTQKIDLLRSPSTGLLSQPGESERDFRIRLQQNGREGRDQLKEEIRAKYAPKVAALEERIRKAQQAVDRESEQASQQRIQTVISVGTTLLGAFLGRKTISSSTLGRATTAVRGAGRAMKESQDIGRAQENVAALSEQLSELNAQFEAETQSLESKTDPSSEPLETITLRPKKTDISVSLVALAWAPHWRTPDGSLSRAF